MKSTNTQKLVASFVLGAIVGALIAWAAIANMNGGDLEGRFGRPNPPGHEKMTKMTKEKGPRHR